MEIIKIRGHDVEIDIAEELSQYDFGYNARWTADKLIASSPFRDDNRASFFVNLAGEYAGTWADSGAIDYEKARGNFVSLIAHLRGISYDEAVDYLLEKYGSLYEAKPGEPIRLPSPKLREPFRYTYIEDNPVTQATSPYLLSRGITAEVQALYGVGYDERHRGFTAIPWHYGGRLANIKYRSTRGKYFFYADVGTPINRLVYGIDQAEETAVICEGEIDAMSWRVAGISAIAIAGAHISREQVEIIKRSRIKRLYLGGDNDEQGRKFNEQVKREISGYKRVYSVDYGEEKDANDVLRHSGVRELQAIIDRSSPIQTVHLRV